MTTPIQSLMQTIADCIHDQGANKGDDVYLDNRNGSALIQYSIGPDDTHETRTMRTLIFTEEQAGDLAILVQDAYNAGWSEGYEAKR